MRERQELPGKLPAGGGVGLQEAVLCQLIRIGRGIREAVHHVADVVKDVGGQLRKDIVPFVLRGDDMRPPKNRIRLGCFGSNGGSLTGTCGPDV